MAYTSSKSSQSGQVVLIVILTIIVALTIGLSIYLNSLTDVSITSTQDRSERALQAAEGAMEDLIAKDDQSLAMLAGNSSSIPVGDLNANVTVKEESRLETTINKLDVVPVKLTGGDAQQVEIAWSHPALGSDCVDGQKPGVIIDRWRQTAVATQVITYVFYSEGCNPTDAKINQANGVSSGKYQSQVILGAGNYRDLDGNSDLALNAEDVLLRVRPIFNGISVLIQGQNGTLPPQVVDITSKAADPDGNETRAIRASRTYSDLPSVFDYALYSGENLVK